MRRSFRHRIYEHRSRLFARYRFWRRRRAGDLPPNVDEITDQLYVGGFIDAEDWRLLFERGITVDVSLQAERLDDFGELLPDAYLWLPTVDHSPPTLEAIRMGVAFISAALDTGKRVLIHCHAGKGRSALLCAATLVARGMRVEEAWKLVKERRPIAGLHAPQWEALKAFAATIDNTGS